MSITISQALHLEGMKDCRVLAGSRNLDIEIENVNILEAVMDSKWDQAWDGFRGQLVLTTFNIAKDNIARQKSIIDSLQRGGCSVLVFQTAIIPALPGEVIEFADQLGFPIIEIPTELAYSSVIMLITEAILKEKTTLLQRSMDIHRKFMDLVLDGDNKDLIACALSDLINRSVAILDPAGNELASSVQKIAPEKYSKLVSFLKESREALVKEVSYDQGIGLLFVPLLSGKQLKNLGYLFVDAQADDLDQLDMIAVEQAAAVATYDLARRRAVQEVERHLRRDFIEELLEGGFHPKEMYLSRARTLGLDLSNRPAVLIIEYSRLSQEVQPGNMPVEDRTGSLREAIFQLISQPVFRHNPLHIFIDRGDSFILLPSSEAKTDDATVKRRINELAAEITRVVKEKNKDIGIQIAVGGFHGAVDRLRLSFSEARSALRLGPMLLPGQNVFWYEELAAFTLFENEEIGSEASRLVEHFLGRLLEYDRSNHTNLVETLEVYFDHNQNISSSAASLYIHPKTMKYRLNRVKDILGTDPFRGHIQFHYYLCTKMARLQTINDDLSDHPYSNMDKKGKKKGRKLV